MQIQRGAITQLLNNIDNAITNIRNQMLNQTSANGKLWLYDLKFNKSYPDPLFNTQQNFGEIIDQAFTYYVSMRAAEELFNKFPWITHFDMNIGANNGTDIESNIASNGEIVLVEVFAAVRPSNNGKLSKEIRNIRKRKPSKAKARKIHRFIFFYCPDPKNYYQNAYNYLNKVQKNKATVQVKWINI